MRQNNHVLSLVDDMDSPRVVGNRLYKIRYVAGFPGVDPKTGKMAAWAAKMAFPPKSYATWESGTRPLPPLIAIKICEWSGNQIDLDYIYRGRFEDLRGRWVRDLAEAPDRPTLLLPTAAPSPPRKPPRKSAPRKRSGSKRF